MGVGEVGGIWGWVEVGGWRVEDGVGLGYLYSKTCCHAAITLQPIIDQLVEYLAPSTFFYHNILSKSPHDAPSYYERTMI